LSEIKTTLELALERTKKISISEEDRDEIKRKETALKVNSLFHRYQEGHLPLNEVLKEIERMDQRTRARVKETLLSQWINALSLNEENERLLRGIAVLKDQEMHDVRVKLDHLLSQYRKERERIEQEMKGQLIEALRSEGIYGSAVDPNIEGSKIWKKESEKLDHSYRLKLEEIKEHLRSL
jgi:hypothetical protein